MEKTYEEMKTDLKPIEFVYKSAEVVSKEALCFDLSVTGVNIEENRNKTTERI